MFDDTRIGRDLLAAIHDQLDTGQAEELRAFALDDPIIFCASALARASDGQLVLSAEQLTLLNRGLRGGASRA